MNKVIKSVIASVMLIISIYCYKIVSDMNIIPNKYLYLLLGIIIVLNLLGILFLFIRGIGFKVVGVIIYIVLGILSIKGLIIIILKLVNIMWLFLKIVVIKN